MRISSCSMEGDKEWAYLVLDVHLATALVVLLAGKCIVQSELQKDTMGCQCNHKKGGFSLLSTSFGKVKMHLN